MRLHLHLVRGAAMPSGLRAARCLFCAHGVAYASGPGQLSLYDAFSSQRLWPSGHPGGFQHLRRPAYRLSGAFFVYNCASHYRLRI